VFRGRSRVVVGKVSYHATNHTRGNRDCAPAATNERRPRPACRVGSDSVTAPPPDTDADHHQPCFLVQRSRTPLMVAMMINTTVSCTGSVCGLTMTFMP
jgi:hypothetical protein